ncbi:FAD-binding domain-containing protein [Aspergillus uvarum CBS 121591]|uniref:FAD-binding domain-containing protein n=1 Tax=Aspergillus uvarum CBS 121591 TaxID=1448315 RepID=A0A319CFR2_9EURO|nr:FAD-binding domain-containing protein [Aspergillus uvarum CBS 121591]PYH83210.1 FAD-binding domain-containing protein [Aspergillus uvarum CBS 121591]
MKIFTLFLPVITPTALAAAAATGTATSSPSQQPAASACRYIPGDRGWPAASTWTRLNATVGGRLLATNPLAHSCHDPTYDNATCTTLERQWGEPSLQIPYPAEFLSPWFQNQSCVPFTDQSTPCELGNYASYSINVTGPRDIVAGLSFAQSNNVRLTIKNTGHDENGKGTGKGALSLWTHNLKDKRFLPAYRSSYYNGPAVQLGAGVQGEEAATFAHQHGYRVVVGSCPTVGVVGGYTQGGGHSSMSGLYGLSADNVLEWEVITATGEHLVATPANDHRDLYWALSGGGPGTYGVVVSMTTRVFPEQPVGAASYSFTVASTGNGSGSSEDAYWQAVTTFHAQMPGLLDQGVYTTYAVTNDSFSIYALVAPSHTEAELTRLLAPMLTALAQHDGLTPQALALQTSGAASLYDLLAADLWPTLAGAALVPVMGGRLITRANIDANVAGVVQAMRTITRGGTFYFSCTGINTTTAAAQAVGPVADNAVLPAWRDTAYSCLVGAAWSWGDSWAPVAGWQAELLDRVLPALEAVTPDSGAYLNEANYQQQNWQQQFYGKNYPRLLAIKKQYDPWDLLYAVSAVGSEAWQADGAGRLCRAAHL